MGGVVGDLDGMLSGMAPQLDSVAYRFVVIAPDVAPQALGGAIGTFREQEGVTAIVPAELAIELDLHGPDFARITLQVHSDLEGVGLTAAVAAALSAEGIACNVVAAFHHDHVFVPWLRQEDAIVTLQRLSQAARREN